jgi:(2Fe-2S) ferredoxin
VPFHHVPSPASLVTCRRPASLRLIRRGGGLPLDNVGTVAPPSVVNTETRPLHVFVCTTTGRHHCGGQGSEKVLQRLRDELERRGITHVRTTRMGCNQQHHQGPIVIVYPDSVWYGHVRADDVPEIIERHLVGGEPVERLRITPDGPWSATALT